MQAIIYLAAMKIMVGVRFMNGEIQIDWANWNLFWPDKACWDLRGVDVTDFPEGTTTCYWAPIGNIIASTTVNMDGILSIDLGGVYGRSYGLHLSAAIYIFQCQCQVVEDHDQESNDQESKTTIMSQIMTG
jgi:hypothetical protein